MEYLLIQESDMGKLVQKVQGFINDGRWKPLGGIAVHSHILTTNTNKLISKPEFYQAVIKE